MKTLHLLRPELGNHRTFCGRDSTTGTVDWTLDRRELEKSGRGCGNCLTAVALDDPLPLDHAQRELKRLEQLNRLSKDGRKVKASTHLEKLVVYKLARAESAVNTTALALDCQRKTSKVIEALESLWDKGLIRKLNKRGWLLSD